MGRSLLFLVSGLFIVNSIARLNNSKKVEAIPERTYDYYYEQQARNISASLVDEAVQNLLKNNDWVGTLTYPQKQDGNGILRTYDQNTIKNLADSVTVPHWDQYTVVLYSTSEYKGYEVTTEVLMSRDSYSKYSYFTNTQGEIYFATTDVLSGPVHTNSTFYMSGNPTFNGLITSPNMWKGKKESTNNPVFNGGSNFNAPVKNYDVTEQFAELKTKANQGGLTFTEDIRVEFKNNGTIDISTYKKVSGTYKWVAVNYNMNSTNGIISTTKKAEVKGTVNGQFTVHSADNMTITGDVEYLDNPMNNFDSTDMLGLVSENNIIFGKDASGTKDLVVHGSLMAKNKIYLEDYDKGSNQGKLTLIGGMIQNDRGAVGTINSNGTVKTGFAKDYKYDERLRYQVPPNFPRESVFSILQWKDKIVQRPETPIASSDSSGVR